jgi:hypothetical protein
MTDVLGYAERMWPEWFPGRPWSALTPVVLAGGPAHQPRATVFAFARGEAKPSVIMKVAFTPTEATFLEQEFRALTEVHRAAAGPILETIPAPLGFDASGRGVILAIGAVEGRRLLVPNVTRRGSPSARRLMRGFLGRSFSWSEELAQAAKEKSAQGQERLEALVEQFVSVHNVPEPARSRMLSFGRALGRSRIGWTAGWQHRDVSVGNVLVHRGSLRLVDWEHAAPGCEPWFDIAYAPGAAVMLAQRQGQSASVREAALTALDRRHWLGAVLAGEMEKAWRYPLPLAWGVALTTMGTALRRERNGRVGWADWVDLALLIFSDDEFRDEVGWLAPAW